MLRALVEQLASPPDAARASMVAARSWIVKRDIN
jgi:hypothetical protein